MTASKLSALGLPATMPGRKTNQRTDYRRGATRTGCAWVEVVRRVREAAGPDCIVIGIAAMDTARWHELMRSLAQGDRSGRRVHHLHHFTWHESQVPTIATMVPRRYAGVTKVRNEASIPVITSNRINMPDVAEAVLVDGEPTWSPWQDPCWLMLN